MIDSQLVEVLAFLLAAWLVSVLGPRRDVCLAAASPAEAASPILDVPPDVNPEGTAPWTRNNEAVPAYAINTAKKRAPHFQSTQASWCQRLLFPDTRCPHCGRQVENQEACYFFLLLGFVGQGLFAVRFLVQWVASEKARAIVVPESFWWISISAVIVTFFYAASILAWPIILGQTLALFVYGRNLCLFKRHLQATQGCPQNRNGSDASN